MQETKSLMGGKGEKVGSSGERTAVLDKREQLFRSGWKNRQPKMPLVSKEEDETFQLLVEWCEGFDKVLSKHRERLSDPTPRMKG
ncbi:MAG: hypothetical protein ACYTFY_11970 [Planctomycetota bacterium]|jgi:hypothetical protein